MSCECCCVLLRGAAWCCVVLHDWCMIMFMVLCTYLHDCLRACVAQPCVICVCCVAWSQLPNMEEERGDPTSNHVST